MTLNDVLDLILSFLVILSFLASVGIPAFSIAVLFHTVKKMDQKSQRELQIQINKFKNQNHTTTETEK